MSGIRIESVGLSGSGKSTLVKACHDGLKSKGGRSLQAASLDALDKKDSPGMPVIWKSERLRQAFHTAEFCRTQPQILDYFNTLYADNRRNMAFIHAVGGDLSKFAKSESEIDAFWVDEGFLHYGIHAALASDHGDASDWVDHLISAMPLPDAVLYTVADPDLALSGLRHRMAQNGRTEPEAEARIEKVFGGAAGLKARAHQINRAVAQLADKGVNIVKIPAHGNIKDMANSALGALGL